MRISDWSSDVCSSDLYWLAFFAWVGQQRYVLWKEQVARLSGAMGAVLGVGRHACRLGADPAIVNRIGEDGIDIAVEIRFLPGVRISLGKGLVDAVQNGHHMVHVRCIIRSEESRVGKKCGSTSRSRWATYR